MSIGSMLTPDQAVVWRGPMATSALRQLLRETDWGGLDVLVVDLPPGTGDIQISLVQQVELAGVVIVSTPQDLALIDAKKAIDMLQADQRAALGLVENMSYFVAPDTGARYDIFGHGGAAGGGRAAGAAVPRRSAAGHGDPRDLGRRPAGGRDRSRRRRGRGVPRDRATRFSRRIPNFARSPRPTLGDIDRSGC